MRWTVFSWSSWQGACRHCTHIGLVRTPLRARARVRKAIQMVMAIVLAALVKALVADLVTPIIAVIIGKPNFGALSFTINSSHFLYGDFINNVVTFVSTGAAVFFFIVKPYNALKDRKST